MLKIFSQSSFMQDNLKFPSHSAASISLFAYRICSALVRRSAKEFQWKEKKWRAKEPCVNRVAVWKRGTNGRSYASAMSHFVSSVPDSLVGEIRSSAGIRHRWGNWDRRESEFFFFFFFRMLKNADDVRNNMLSICEVKMKLHLRNAEKRNKYDDERNIVVSLITSLKRRSCNPGFAGMRIRS